MTSVIEIEGLRKSFGRALALDGLDLQVRSGEVHGFLGPNGSGKSTTLRILLGLLRSDGGTVRVMGMDPWSAAPTLHARLAYVPGDVSLWPNLTGGEVIDLLGRLRGGVDPSARDRLVAAFQLDPTKKGRSYSKGNRQKVALIAALAADVPLLLLDEPTSGLDPLMERVFTREVRRQRDAGRTILLSSHVLSEVEAVADRVSIIRDGRTVSSGTLADLRGHTRTTVLATLATAVPLEVVRALPGVREASVQGAVVRLSVDSANAGAVVARLNQAGLRSLTCSPPSLEELFLSEYTR